MASEQRHRFLSGLGPLLACAALVTLPLQALRANEGLGSDAPPCPWVAVPKGQSYLQPERLPPARVKGKNALGCLSPADAIYGADGCPLRFCGGQAGAFPLPPAP